MATVYDRGRAVPLEGLTAWRTALPPICRRRHAVRSWTLAPAPGSLPTPLPSGSKLVSWPLNRRIACGRGDAPALAPSRHLPGWRGGTSSTRRWQLWRGLAVHRHPSHPGPPSLRPRTPAGPLLEESGPCSRRIRGPARGHHALPVLPCSEAGCRGIPERGGHRGCVSLKRTSTPFPVPSLRRWCRHTWGRTFLERPPLSPTVPKMLRRCISNPKNHR